MPAPVLEPVQSDSSTPIRRFRKARHARSDRGPGNAWLREIYLRQTRPLYEVR